MNTQEDNGVGTSMKNETLLIPENQISHTTKTVLTDLTENLIMENEAVSETLSLEEFTNVLERKGGEKERLALLDQVGKGLLTSEDTFFFYISEKQYALHRKDRIRGADEKGSHSFEKGAHTFVAPLSLYRLFNNNKKGNQEKGPMQYHNMQVSIGKGSNIQELRAFSCNRPDKQVKISIGDNTSLAHNVGFKVEDTTDKAAEFFIGDRVFIGINSTLEDGVTINSGKDGNYTTVGFGCHLQRGCSIGSGCIVGDGATIGEGVSLPSNTVVLPGVKITKENIGNQTDMESFQHFDTGVQQTFKGLVHVHSAEDRKKLKEMGPSLAFLDRFNEHVLEDNHTFPTMYKLVKKIHGAEHVETIERNQGHFVNIDLPKDKDEFLYHYYKESLQVQAAEAKGEVYEVKKYPGDFTKVEIEDTVTMSPGAIMYNVGETKITGNSYIEGLIVNRSGDEGGSLTISDSHIKHGVVFHANGEKKIEKSTVSRWSIIHGKTKISAMTVGENVLIHNSDIDASQSPDAKIIDSWTTIVGAVIKDSSIGAETRILGHGRNMNQETEEARSGVYIENSYVPCKCVIRNGSTILGSKNMPIGTTAFFGSKILE